MWRYWPCSRAVGISNSISYTETATSHLVDGEKKGWREEEKSVCYLVPLPTQYLFSPFSLLTEPPILFWKAIGPVENNHGPTAHMTSSGEENLSIYLLTLFSVEAIVFLINRETQLAIAFSLFFFPSFCLKWNYPLVEMGQPYSGYKTDISVLKMAEQKDRGSLVPFSHFCINPEFSTFVNVYMRKIHPCLVKLLFLLQRVKCNTYQQGGMQKKKNETAFGEDTVLPESSTIW